MNINIHNSVVTRNEVDQEFGFAFIVFENEGVEYSLQACLLEGKKKPYIKQVDKNDSGMDWGSCGEANAKAFEEFGKDASVAYFFLKIEGVKFA